jgi:hypothetical protein
MGMRINQAGNQTPGQGMSATLSEEEKKKQQEQPQAQEQNQPTQLATQAGTAQASAVKAAPKQQKAGTGTFANLKSYLQAAQGGGQQKIAQAATQKVQNVATGAQKGISQATQTFGKQLEAGSLANMGTAAKDVQAAIDAARGTVYQAQQPIAAPERPIDRTIGGPAYRVGINPPPNPIERATQDYLKNLLGDKYQDYRNEMDNRSFLNPDGSKMELGDILQSRKKIFEKYGIDQTKLPGYRDSNLEDDVRRNMPMDPNRIITWGPESLIGRENINAKLDTEIPAQPTTPTAPTSAEVTPEQQQRFADIINAKYGGPGSIQEAGLYNRAAEKARTAQEAIKQTQTAAGREQLLRNIFSQNRDYSGKLDALLLNASQQGVGQLQQQAQQAGNLQQKLQQAQTESANLATGRAKEIADIQQQARKSFLEGRTAEETGTESRIDKLIKEPVVDPVTKEPIQKLTAEGKPMVDSAGNPVYMTQWDQLPEYYRGIIRNREATNKAELDKKIAEFTAQNPAVSNAQIRAAEKARIAAYQKFTNREGEYTQFTPEQIAQREAGIKKADQAYKDLVAQKKSYETGLQKLKSGTNLNALNLSPEEAAVLGISSGEGIYNLGQGLIQDVAAERGRLITKDELARQQALARLAGTDLSKALQKELLYSDMEKAGTQNLQSSLNTEAIRNALNEAQQKFKESAESAELTGVGEKKVSRGNLLGKKTSTYSANVEGNVADMLRQAGYDVSSLEPEQAKSLLSNKDLLDKYLKATSTSRAEEANIGGKTLEGTAAGASTGAAIGAGAPGAAIGAAIGGTLGANTLDPFQATSDLYKELESKLGIKGLGAVGQGVEDIRSGAGGIISGAGNIAGTNVVGDIFRGIGGVVGGINTGAMKAYGSAKAKELAIKDLENKYKAYLAGQGFENRANIVNTDATAARTAALQELLRRQG